jgi:signal transduction histidine kinase
MCERVEYGRRVSRFRPFMRRYWVEVLIVLVALEGALEIALRRDAPQAPRSTLWFAVPAFAAVVLSLVGRRRFPFLAAAGVWLLAAAFSFVDGRLIVFTVAASVAGMIAAFSLGNLRDDFQARLGLLVVLGCAATLAFNEPGHSSGELVAIPMLFAIGWLAGFVVRERTAQAEAADVRAATAEREREAAARLAVAEERARIARELHDIVAHSVSVMVLHVGTVRRKLPDELAADRDALTGVEETGRAALTEMRRLLGAMRHDGDGVDFAPQPGVDRLEVLVEEVGRTGLSVDLRIEGEPVPLPPGIDLSAYRIVQEGLTNVLKHAEASQAEVLLRYEPGRLQIDVSDDGAGNSSSDGLGHGLVGIRERVKIYGGEVNAGPTAAGGFLLSARLPLEDGPA